jgi:hypothetical protein
MQLFKNKFVVRIYSPTTWQFVQLPLVALPIILPHADAISVEGSRICNPVIIYVCEIFHQSICYVP